MDAKFGPLCAITTSNGLARQNCTTNSPSYPSLFRRVRQPLDHILALGHAHDRHPGHLPQPPLQIAIVGRDDVDAVPLHAVHDAIVGVHALVVALQTLPALVTGDAQGNAVFGPEFLEFGHDARGDCGDAFGVEGVHEGGEEVEFVGDGVGEEVCVEEDGVGGLEGGVVGEEEGGLGWCVIIYLPRVAGWL